MDKIKSLVFLLILCHANSAEDRHLLHRLSLSDEDGDYLANKLFAAQRNLVASTSRQTREKQLDEIKQRLGNYLNWEQVGDKKTAGVGNYMNERGLEQLFSPSVEEQQAVPQFSYRAYPVFKKSNRDAVDDDGLGRFGNIIRSNEPHKKSVDDLMVSHLPGTFLSGPISAKQLGANIISREDSNEDSMKMIEGKLLDTLRYAKSKGIEVHDLVQDLNKESHTRNLRRKERVADFM